MGRILCLLVLLCATGARAEEDATPAPAPPAPKAARPKLTLDRLLRVPTTTVQSSEIRGGRDRKAWQEEFSRLRREIRELDARIAAAQAELRASAGGDWAFSPTGGGPPQDPEVLQLRARLRRDRQSLEVAGQRLRGLEVEASLAEVPEAWRHPESE